MDKDFYNDGFEQLLKERTEEFKMYPSESVWNNIFNKLHPGRRWGVIGGSMLLLLFTASVLIFRNTNNNVAVVTPATSNIGAGNNHTTANSVPETKFSRDNNIAAVNTFNTVTDLQQGIISNDARNNTSLATAKSSIVANNKPIYRNTETNGVNNVLSKEESNVATTYTSVNERVINEELSNSSQSNIIYKVSPENSNAIYELAGRSLEKADGTEKEKVLQPVNISANAGSINNGLAKTTSAKKYSRFEWQLYFTPSISYRALYNDYNNTNLAYAFNSFIPGNIDKAVNHTPALGFEIGNVVMFSLNKSIKIKTGLQFNYSRYNIKAYSTNPELTTLRLRGAYNQTEELKVASSYKNYGVYYHSTTISSQNSAISVPIGIDLKLAGKNKISWYVSGSFQPTYIINNKAYLISNDLRNYVRNSELYRKFTMNSGFETYLRIEKGNGVALQIGPQLRYQINSSYTKNYPISEHLIEYGVKLGITKRF